MGLQMERWVVSGLEKPNAPSPCSYGKIIGMSDSLPVDEGDFPLDGNPDHIYVRQAAEILNRRMGTLRKWDQLGVLPRPLRPHRGIRNWRYWTPEQIDGIREWMRETDRRSGRALAHWNPTEKEIDKAIEAMRKPHSPKRKRVEEIELA